METTANIEELKSTRRGAKRPDHNGASSTLAATTNDPIALVKTNIAKNADARRWRDLMLYYKSRIGDIRMRDESVRVRVLSLVNATTSRYKQPAPRGARVVRRRPRRSRFSDKRQNNWRHLRAPYKLFVATGQTAPAFTCHPIRHGNASG